MSQRIHILRPDSVTPIEQYLERRRFGAADYKAQVSFACVLFYREREYRSMYGSSWRPDHLPTASAGSPFAPYDLTPQAEAAIAVSVHSIWGLATSVDAPEDLFGLKEEALDGLTQTMRAIKGHAFGFLLASKILRDLTRYAEAVDMANRGAEAGADAVLALALAYESALLSPADRRSSDATPATAIEQRARKHLTKLRRWRPNWHTRALEQLNERIRRHALDARTRVEGETFTRFLSTEADFCERERLAGLESFDESHVPADLRDLIPIAQRFGIGDDPCRALTIRRTPAPERRAVVATINAHAARISAWLAELGDPPYETAAACFFWLLEAAEEMTPRKR